MVVDGAVDPEGDALEPPEAGEDSEHACAEDDALRAVREAAGGEDEVVEEVCEHEHREVKRRKLRWKTMSARMCGEQKQDERSGGCM